MTGKITVVTPERFIQGVTYSEFIAKINVNKDRFDYYYETASEALSPADIAAFNEVVHRPGGAARVLVLGEPWCPDVYRGMPVIARIAETSGMEMRVFPRDENLDIMNEFLKEGRHPSIPTVVFYTSDQKYICHWIERPKIADMEIKEIDWQLEQDATNNNDREGIHTRRDLINARFPYWQEATVAELRELLNADGSPTPLE